MAPAIAAMAMAPPKAWKFSPSEMNSARFQTKSSPQAIQPSAMKSSTPGNAALKLRGGLAWHDHIRRPQQGNGGAEQHECRGAEGDARAQHHQRPTGEQWCRNADDRGDGLARADLLAAMVRIAQRGEIGVIAGPVKRIAKDETTTSV